jgi:hypothetical protein
LHPSDGPGSVVLTLRVPAEFACRTAQVTGDFTEWSPVTMSAEPGGSRSITMRLASGRAWKYRFVIDGSRWINDPRADDDADCIDGGAASVLCT